MSYLESLMSTGETVQFLSRQHVFTIVRSVLVNGFLIAVALFAFGFSSQRVAADAGVAWQAGVVASALVAALAVFWLARDMLTWLNRQYVVSTRRVLEIEGVFNKVVRDSNLDKVNDIILRQSFLGRILNYGDLEIITGSDIGVNDLLNLSRPIEFKRHILDNKEDFDTISRARVAAQMPSEAGMPGPPSPTDSPTGNAPQPS